jgi:opacity protein-like surface antigen
MLLVALIAGAAGPAAAQSVGIGPRMSFVRGHIPSGTSSSSYWGGILRLRASKHMSFELSLDRKTVYSEDRTLRSKETPFQASLLLYPVRSAFAPYLLGGFGIYKQAMESVDPGGDAVGSVETQNTGWHVGGGLELMFGRHVGIYGDYRFRFVNFGSPDSDSDPIDLPGLPSSLKLSHKGSMWTGGVAFYF